MEILRRLDACTVANAIETFHQRLRNEGFADGSVRCLSPQLPPMLGYAATVKVRGSSPATAGPDYQETTEWWDYLLSLPRPRVLVVQDIATRQGLGSLVGAVHMNLLQRLDCIGVVTNGSVRNIPVAMQTGFHLFAGSVTVSHAYVHIVDYGAPIEIGGLKIQSGDLLHGDLHGVQSIPLELAGQIPAAAAEIISAEREIITLCQSKEVPLETLRAALVRRKF